MKSITAMAFTYLCLSFGCMTDGSTPLPEEAEAQAELTSCSSHDVCPVGTYCSTGGYCSGFVIGPTPGPTCGNDYQCPGQRCTNTSPNLGTYGACVTPSCAIQFSPAYVPAGGTSLFTLTSNAPSGSLGLIYGTRDGQQDGFGFAVPAPTSFVVANSPGLAGFYMRYVDVYAPNSQFWCRTASVYSYLAP